MKFNVNAPYWIMMKAAEAQILKGSLDHAGGVASDAAAYLGIEASSFRRRCRAVGVPLKIRGRRRRPERHSRMLPMRYPALPEGAKEET